MSGIHHGAMVDSLCIRCFVTCMHFCRLKVRNIHHMAGTWNAKEEFTMIMDTVSALKVAIYGLVRQEEVKKPGKLCPRFRFHQLHRA